jgi:hypothetical protein
VESGSLPNQGRKLQVSQNTRKARRRKMNEWDSTPNRIDPAIEAPNGSGKTISSDRRLFGGSIGFVLAILFSIIFLFLC